jgi:pimeloyl-ACP methyl ester carboxylesterase
MTHPADRPSLLILHGALGSRCQFDDLADAISDIRRPHAIDFEGHGDAPLHVDAFRGEQFAAQTVKYMDEHSIEQADIFGYSLGGYVGCIIARGHPDRVRSMYMLATKFFWTPEIALRECAVLDPDVLEIRVPTFASTLLSRHRAIGWRRNMELTRDMLLHFGSHPPLTLEDAAAITHPVRIAVGDRDNLVGIDESARLAKAMQQGQLEVLPGTPHPFERVALPRLAYSLREWFSSP